MRDRPTPESLRSALDAIPADLDRETWLRVGMAIHAELPNADGFALFDTWSARGASYDARAVRDTWRSFKPGPVRVASLFGIAKDHGWRPSAPADAAKPTAAELAARAAERRAGEERAARETEERQRRGAADAAALWNRGSDEGASPYLARKKVGNHGGRFLADGTLLVPLRDAAGELVNVQSIRPERPADGSPEKLFVRGARKSGAFHLVGNPEGAAWLLVAEGYATAASCHEATGRPVAVAFDAGNLAHVVRMLRGRWPALRLAVCGDDDAETAARTGKNPGRLKASEAAKLARGPAIFPPPEMLAAGGTDWNDAHQCAGLAAVRDAIEAALRAAEAAEVAPSPAPRQKNAPAARRRPAPGTDASDDGRDERGPRDRFRCDEDGLWFDGGDKPVRVCAPLRVLAEAKNSRDTAAALVLEFEAYGKLRRWLMPASMVCGDGTAYRTELATQGFKPPTERTRRALLNDYLGSRQPGEVWRHTPKVGWDGHCYVLPDETLGTPTGEPVIFHSEAGIDAKFGRRGTLSKWQEGPARLCVGNSRLMFAVSVAFAGPLLAWSPSKKGGGIHYVGDTSIGKTTGLLLAASVWGKGSEADPESYMQKWRSTANGLEYLGEQHNDCTLILDELGQMDATDAGSSAYMLADGMGKARSKSGGGLRLTPTWRTLFLSSGELTLAQQMESIGKKQKGGQEVRLIAVPAEVSPGSTLETLHEFESGHELSEWVTRQTAVCYGHAGRAWLEWLVDNTARLPRLIERHMQAFERRFVKDEAAGQVKRGARRFGLAAAAGEIASTEAKLTGWPEGEAMRMAGVMFNAWIASRPGGWGGSEEEQILRDLGQWFAVYGEINFKRWGDKDGSHAPNPPMMCGWKLEIEGDTRNKAGQLIKVPVARQWYVLAEPFRALVCKGHNPRTCLDVLKRHDLIELEPSGRMSHNAKPTGWARSGATCYRIKGEILARPVDD